MLRAIFGTVHWPLLVAAGLALLAVRPFPSHFFSYAARAEQLARRFLDLRGRLSSSPRAHASNLALSDLTGLHQAFKSLECPDAASGYHWAVSEAMRFDIEALFGSGSPREREGYRTEADRYWRRAADEARRFTAA